MEMWKTVAMQARPSSPFTYESPVEVGRAVRRTSLSVAKGDLRQIFGIANSGFFLLCAAPLSHVEVNAKLVSNLDAGIN
jgi:hypothetical protein